MSPWGAPVWFKKEKYGTHKMCIDFRPLRKFTMKNKYPFPRIDDLFDQVRGSKVFSNIDLGSGDHQVRFKDGNVHKETFKARYGSYDVVVVSFSLKNAPATSMCLMNNVFGKSIYRLVLVLLDAIL